MSAIYLSCKQCLQRYRVERIDPSTNVQDGPFKCPGCGNVVSWSQDLEQDYWYTLAASFNLPKTQEGVKIIRGIYDLWDTEEYHSFRDFVEALKKGD